MNIDASNLTHGEALAYAKGLQAEVERLRAALAHMTDAYINQRHLSTDEFHRYQALAAAPSATQHGKGDAV